MALCTVGGPRGSPWFMEKTTVAFGLGIGAGEGVRHGDGETEKVRVTGQPRSQELARPGSCCWTVVVEEIEGLRTSVAP